MIDVLKEIELLEQITEAAEDIERAIDNVLSKGYRTSDLDNGNCQVLSCSQIGEKIIKEI